MSFSVWNEAVATIDSRLKPAGEAVVNLARQLDVVLPETTPDILAAAIIRAKLAPILENKNPGPPTDSQLEFLGELAALLRMGSPPECPDTVVCDAWIRLLSLRNRKESLERLRLNRGDLCRRIYGDGGSPLEVSSISGEGRVYFKGASAAWPDQIEVIVRHDDQSAKANEWRKKAANAAANRITFPRFSGASAAELKRFEVEALPTEDQILQLERIVAHSNDERPIQRFLSEAPELLSAALLSRAHGQYVVPQARLGSEFVTDFLLADVDSSGIHWLAVELESPTSPMFLKSGQLEHRVRKGVDQIQQWREWLQNNLDYARRRQASDGLGLEGIRPRLKGLVIVGQRHLMRREPDRTRAKLREESDIHIHSYEWLIERANSGIARPTPWAGGPLQMVNESL